MVANGPPRVPHPRERAMRIRLLRAAVLGCAFALGAPVAAQSVATRRLGLDTAGFDRTVRPQDDFDRFVNGGWRDRTEIPSDRSAWGSFYDVDERTQAALKATIEAAAASGARSGVVQKVGDFYASYMDSTTIERRGIDPLLDELFAIRRIESHAGLPAALARLQRIGVSGPFSGTVQQDPKRSSVYVVSVGQIDVPLGDRNFYMLDSDAFKKVRSEYVDYLTKLFTLASIPDPAGASGRVMALETEIARVQWDRVRNRDTEATYNPRKVEELVELTPSFSWSAYLVAAGMGGVRAVVVRQPDYLRAMDAIVASTPLATWQEYLTARLLDGYANELPNAFAEARFQLRGRTLSGLKERPPRWKRGVAEVETGIGEALGRLYVERNFPPEAKARMDAFVQNLLAAFRDGIDELAWMSPATKAQARAKLARLTVKIGYPEKWDDFAGVDVREDDLLGNVLRARAFRFDAGVARLGKPVDRTRWEMTPQTVNAYYNPANNEIAFSAAILVPPFFDVAADDAVNYGAIGGGIGHEISHGFDDQGRKWDGDGNLVDWWTAEDARALGARADRLASQFDRYVPVDTLHVNGRQTLGENIGDLSGLAVAHRAYRIALGGREPPVIGGFTVDQRFFMGWAQVWRSKMRPERARQLLQIDVHAPDAVRAFAPMTNSDAFYRAFDVREGDRMYRAPGERVRIW
ncbi:MAG: M13 family peptidase [Gemmatimonadetes bacterium]|nr:M13 family peptidase [Gemmatimonadota bacterium]